MTPEEKKEIARITLKCILAVGYIFLGLHYLCEVLFHKEEEEEIEIGIEEEDKHVIVNIMQFRKHEEEEKHDA